MSGERRALWRSAGGRLIMLSVLLGAGSGLLRVVPVALVYALLLQLDDRSVALWLTVAIAAAAIGKGLVQTSAMTASFTGARLVEWRLRERLLRHLDRVPLGWFLTSRAGVVRQAVLDDTRWPSGVYSEIYVGLARTIVQAVATVAFLLWVSIPLTVVVLLVGLLRLLPTPSASSVEQAHHAQQRGEEEINARVTELTDGLPVLRAFGAGAEATARLDEAVRSHAGSSVRVDVLDGATRRWVDLGRDDLLALVLILLGGSALIASDWAEPIALAPFLLLGGGVGEAISALAGTAGMRRRNQMVLAGIEEVLAAPTLEIVDAGGGSAEGVDGAGAAVELRDVSFAYESGRPVMTDVSLRIEQGSRVALVGPSGAGKSTLARLLPRFWDVDAGTVSVLGDDVRNLPPAELYRRIGFVFQDAQLLGRSIVDNLRLADADATGERIEEVMRALRLHERITALPRGYDSVIGEDAELSGGQAQRLAIARALVAGPPVLVVDEPTAHADAETDMVIRSALTGAGDRTLVMITHRLATTTDFDRLIVLDHGRVVEDGTHDELVAAGGLYARMWRDQQQAQLGGELSC